MTTLQTHAQGKEDPTKTILAMEKAALERWFKGDIYGPLEIYAQDITYFDPYLQKRLDGFEQVKALYLTLQGKVNVPKYELINPQVQIAGNVAVLTYNLTAYGTDNGLKWNSTQVYRLENDGRWRIIHAHWSLIGGK